MGVRTLTVRERILLHLFDFARFAEDYEAPLEVTQDGIAKAVAIQLPHVNQYVRPLIESGFVEERTKHIERQARRRKVYFLTMKGRQDVAALRTTLLKEEVPFKKATGEVTPVLLAKVYHEERRGSPLLQLVGEANAKGWVTQVVEVEVTPTPDFTEEAPKVERFYGRKPELEALLRAVEEKPIVVVTGFAGIGKSTLGAKVCESLRGTRALFWRRIRPWDTSQDLASRLAAFLKAQGRTSLHNLLSLSEANELSRIEELLAVDFAGLHAIVIFDDIQEASPDADAFLALLARVLQNQKGSVGLFLSRSAPRFYSQREVVVEGSVTELPIGGLDKKSSAALLSEAGVPTSLINRFAKSSGGNPLFLQLFARTPHNEAVEGGWNTVATYIAEQVEPSLDPAERDCLEAACLYDIPVSADALLLEGRAAMKTLVGLKGKGLLGQVGTGKYVLHDTLKEFFQRSLAPERKAPLSAKIVTWLLEQAKEAANLGNPHDAVGHLNNAAKLEIDRRRWAGIMERIGEMRLLLLHLTGADGAFRAALREVTDPRDRARLHGQIARVMQYDGLRLDQANREIDEALALLPTDPTPEAVLLYIRKADIALFERDFDRTDEAAQRAAEIAERLPPGGDLRARATLTRARARIHGARRFDFAAVEADCRAAIDFFEKVGNDWLATVALGDYSIALTRDGRIAEALPITERCLSHARASGHQPNIGSALSGVASILYEYVGDSEGAEAFLQERLIHARRAGISWMFFETYVEFANVLRRQGRYEEARESLEYFLHMTSDGILYRLSLTWWLGGRLNDLTLMVRLCARTGDTESGAAYLQQARDLAATRQPEMSAFALAWAEAALQSARGELDDADASYRRALAHPIPFFGQRMGHEDEPRAECMLDYGRFLASRGEKEAAKELIGTALNTFSSRSMKPLAEEATEALRSLES